jgi:integrase
MEYKQSKNAGLNGVLAPSSRVQRKPVSKPVANISPAECVASCNRIAPGGTMEQLLANINFKVRLGRRTGTSKRVIYSFQAANKSLKELTFWDTDLPGFGMRVYRSGKRSYFIQYRERRDNRKHSIGDADTMDPRMARRKARELLSKVKLGFGVVDPLAAPEKIGAMRFDSFARLFFDRYAHHWSLTVRESEQRRCARHVVPFFGSKLLLDIERADILRWRDGLVDKAATANRLLPTLSSIFKAAEQLGLRPKGCNPCANIGRLKTRARDQFLTVADIARLGVALKAHEDCWPQDCALIRLLLLTGARKAEIETLEWDWLDGAVAHLPRSKTGPKTLFLGAQAQTALASLPRAKAVPFVFPSADGSKAARVKPYLWNCVRKAAGLQQFTLHDLRHSFASHAAMNGVTMPVMSRLLGHALLESTERYAHLDTRSVRDAATRVSGHLARVSGFVWSGDVQ